MKQEDAFELPQKEEKFLGVYEPNDTLWGIPLENTNKEDEVNHPKHYASGGIECLDAMEAMVSQTTKMEAKLKGHDYYLWQVIFKYIWRFPYKKNPTTDLKKARFYLEKLINSLEKTDNAN